MAPSKTWQNRLYRARTYGRRAGIALMALGSTFGLASACGIIGPQPPDVGAAIKDVCRPAPIAAFSKEFIITWLSASSKDKDARSIAAERAQLQPFITIGPDEKLPTTPLAVVVSASCYGIRKVSTVGDAELYSVLMSVRERAYASAPTTTALYEIPVSWWRHAARVTDKPARLNPATGGADLKSNYTTEITRCRQESDTTQCTADPIYSMLTGFITTYLTGTTGLDRYATATSGLSPIGGYQTANITAVSAAGRIPNNPPDRTRIHVLVHVVAQTSQFAPETLTYPLVLESNNRTWMVAGVDTAPQPNPNSEVQPAEEH